MYDYHELIEKNGEEKSVRGFTPQPSSPTPSAPAPSAPTPSVPTPSVNSDGDRFTGRYNSASGLPIYKDTDGGAGEYVYNAATGKKYRQLSNGVWVEYPPNYPGQPGYGNEGSAWVKSDGPPSSPAPSSPAPSSPAPSSPAPSSPAPSSPAPSSPAPSSPAPSSPAPSSPAPSSPAPSSPAPSSPASSKPPTGTVTINGHSFDSQNALSDAAKYGYDDDGVSSLCVAITFLEAHELNIAVDLSLDEKRHFFDNVLEKAKTDTGVPVVKYDGTVNSIDKMLSLYNTFIKSLDRYKGRDLGNDPVVAYDSATWAGKTAGQFGTARDLDSDDISSTEDPHAIVVKFSGGSITPYWDPYNGGGEAWNSPGGFELEKIGRLFY